MNAGCHFIKLQKKPADIAKLYPILLKTRNLMEKTIKVPITMSLPRQIAGPYFELLPIPTTPPPKFENKVV